MKMYVHVAFTAYTIHLYALEATKLIFCNAVENAGGMLSFTSVTDTS